MPMNIGPFQQQMANQQAALRRPSFNPVASQMGQQFGLMSQSPAMSMNLNPYVPGNPGRGLNSGMGGSNISLSGAQLQPNFQQQIAMTPGYNTGGVVAGKPPAQNAVQAARAQQGPPPVTDPSQAVLAAYNQGR